jgi:hypothetical protein
MNKILFLLKKSQLAVELSKLLNKITRYYCLIKILPKNKLPKMVEIQPNSKINLI